MATRYIILVNAGGEYGFGHAVRMLALAERLAQKGRQVGFATRTEALTDVVPSLSYPIDVYSDADTDLEILNSAAGSHRHGRVVFVVDIPNVSPSMLKGFTLSASSQRTGVVRVDHPWAEQDTADLLVVPNAHQTPSEVEMIGECFGWGRTLYGFDYTIISQDVAAMKRPRYRKRDENTVAFMAGGSDPGASIPTMWEMVSHINLHAEPTGTRPRHVWCVAGGVMACDHTKLRPHDVIVLAFSRSAMRHVMLESSLLVCMFGVTVYEALYLGLPVITMTRTMSDAKRADCLEELTLGAVRHLGMFSLLQREQLCEAIEAAMADPGWRANASYLGSKLIDGHGADRVADALVRRFG
ncbi:MAG TPA: hypothetical protein VNP04_13535 [Alphaproteobacteria bacterium]|nr:hypothetical protein [Alphaproteobacteria bacterium]